MTAPSIRTATATNPASRTATRESRKQQALRVLRRPDVRTDLIQITKTVVATVLAWYLAVRVLGSEQPFLAPWAALLAVHATLYRTFRRGAQTVAATLVGIGLSFVVVLVLGYGAVTLGLAVLAGLLVARTPLIRQEGITAATTTIFVLTASAGTDQFLLIARMLDTVLGVGVGVLVNVVLVPPMDDRVLEESLDRVNIRLGRLLQRIAADIATPMSREHSEQWFEETRGMDADLDHAETMLGYTRESQRFNPRSRRSRHGSDVESGRALLVRLEEGVAQARTICRTIDESAVAAHAWDDRFLQPWVDLMDRTGRRVADPEADVSGLHDDVDDLTRKLGQGDLSGLHWPLYGALINALVNIINVVDDVASSSEVRSSAGS